MRDRKTQTDALPVADEDLPLLSDDQRRFADYLQRHGGTAAEAYRATQACKDMTDTAVYAAASRMARSAPVRAYQTACTAAGIIRATLTADEYIVMSLAHAERAEASGNHGAAVKSRENAARAANILGNDGMAGDELPRVDSLSKLLHAVAQGHGRETAAELAAEVGATLPGENLH